jgi:hypothetical protein
MPEYGTLQFPSFRKAVLGGGIQTDLVTLLGPGARIAAYVRSSGFASGGDPDLNLRAVTTLNAGLAQCRSGMGDIVLVAHDHAENVSSADYMSSLVAGTRIVGLGYGNLRPTFTWTAQAATWLLDVANVTISNCIMKMAGPSGTTALTVDAPMTISAAGCALLDCEFQCEIDADQGSVIAVTTTAGATDLTIAGNKFYGSSNGTLPTTYLQVVGGVRLKMYDNNFHGATSSATVGIVRFATTASTDIDVRGNRFTNQHATAAHAVTNLATDTGHASGNTFEPDILVPQPASLGLAAGGKITFCDSTAATSIANLLGVRHDFQVTLNAALAKCRSAKGDAVVVLPGHTESVASADQMSSLVAGTRIIGMGTGTNRPTFTWTTTGSTFLLDVAGATLENCILILATTVNAGVSVTAPLSITAAGCKVLGCMIRVDGDADDLATIPITISDAADDLEFADNDCYGATAAVCTTFISIAGADRLKFLRNRVVAATTAVAIGVVRFVATAATNVLMTDNYFYNAVASGTCAVTGIAGVTGHFNRNSLQVVGANANAFALGHADGAFGVAATSMSFGNDTYISSALAAAMIKTATVDS